MTDRDRRDEPPRVHVDGSVDGEGPTVERGSGYVPRRTATVTAFGMLAVGLLGGWMIGAVGRDSTAVTESESTAATTVATTTAVPLTTTTLSRPPTTLRFPLTSLEVLRAAGDLQGMVVVAPHPGASGGAPLWILSGEGLIRRFEVPLWPGDYPHPLILSSNQVAFADLENAYLVDVNLDAPPRAVSEGSFLLPSGTPDNVWIVGRASTWIAQLNTSTGAVGERFDVSDVISWPEAGLESGLVVRPVDEAAFGRVAYWAPEAVLRSLAVDDPDSRLLATSDTLAVFLAPDNMVQVLDVIGSVTVGRFSIDVGESMNVDACISPDGSSVVFYGAETRDVVVSLTNGEILTELQPDEEREQIDWVSPNQLVVQTTAAEGRILQTIDLTTGTSTDLASLTGLGSWWVTASGSNC